MTADSWAFVVGGFETSVFLFVNGQLSMVNRITKRTRVRRKKSKIEIQMFVYKKRLFFLLHFEFYISSKRLFFLLKNEHEIFSAEAFI